MKSIKYFKYKNTNAFESFLSAYGYKLDDVKGFSYVETKQCDCNVLKVYSIHFKDDEYEYFKIVYFKSFNECNQSRFYFSRSKLSEWYDSADVIKYKTNNGWSTIKD